MKAIPVIIIPLYTPKPPINVLIVRNQRRIKTTAKVIIPTKANR